MPSGQYADDGFDVARGGPVGSTARRHRRALLAVFLLVATAVTAAAMRVDPTAAVPASAVSGRPRSNPLSVPRLALEAGTLSGAVASGVALVGLLGRDERVSPSRGRRHVALATVAFAAAVVLGRRALPGVVELVGALAPPSRPPLDASWTAEMWLFFPVSLGFAAAAPFLLVAAVRSGAVGRFVSPRQRGYVALAFVAFAACYSPADGATFVLFSTPLFAGFALGVAWLEFR